MINILYKKRSPVEINQNNRSAPYVRYVNNFAMFFEINQKSKKKDIFRDMKNFSMVRDYHRRFIHVFLDPYFESSALNVSNEQMTPFMFSACFFNSENYSNYLSLFSIHIPLFE